MKKERKTSTGIKAATVWRTALAVAALISAPAGAATLQADVVGSSSVTVGQSFTVDVDVTGIADLYGFQFDLSFNPTLVQETGLSEGSFLPAACATPGCTSYWWTPGTVDNTDGVVAGTFDSLSGPQAGAAGTGTLAVFTFLATGVGAADFTISNPVNPVDPTIPAGDTMLLDSNGIDVTPTPTSTPGVDIAPLPPPTSVPEPATTGLMAAALAAAWVSRRTRHRTATR